MSLPMTGSLSHKEQRSTDYSTLRHYWNGRTHTYHPHQLVCEHRDPSDTCFQPTLHQALVDSQPTCRAPVRFHTSCHGSNRLSIPVCPSSHQDVVSECNHPIFSNHPPIHPLHPTSPRSAPSSCRFKDFPNHTHPKQ